MLTFGIERFRRIEVDIRVQKSYEVRGHTNLARLALWLAQRLLRAGLTAFLPLTSPSGKLNGQVAAEAKLDKRGHFFRHTYSSYVH